MGTLEGLSPGERTQAQQSGSGLGGAWREPKKYVCGWDSAILQAEGPAGSPKLLGPSLLLLSGCPARLQRCGVGGKVLAVPLEGILTQLGAWPGTKKGPFLWEQFGLGR